MRNQHVGRASRVALFAALFASLSTAMWACQDPQPETSKDASSDFALGVDGDFGVKTFAMGTDPSISFSLPAALSVYYIEPGSPHTAIPGNPCSGPPSATPGSQGTCAETAQECNPNALDKGVGDCDPFVKFNIGNFQPGWIDCRINGGPAMSSNDPFYEVPNAPNMMRLPHIGSSQGLYTIECYLVDLSGPAPGPNARDHRSVQLIYDPLNMLPSQKCVLDSDCNDNNACSTDLCKSSKCTYYAQPFCCTDDYICPVGNSCLNPNTANSKCSPCQPTLADPTGAIECADILDCTVDACDLSGPIGVCTHTKGKDVCCSNEPGICDDGKPCTNDYCDTVAGVCKHDQDPGSCCSDAECPSPDPCKVGYCQALKCRVGSFNNKPGCCNPINDGTPVETPIGTVTPNSACDDKNLCTYDSCSIQMGSGPTAWMQCKHELDPNDKSCCKDFTDCADGNGCTQDLCTQNKCEHPAVPFCCADDSDCTDSNTCTVDNCQKNPGENTGTCPHTKIPECCNSVGDCNDNLFCTADSCDALNHKCNHMPSGPESGCCDVDTQCFDGKKCTVDVCANHSCHYQKDANDPDCCEDTNPLTCNDGDLCNLDSCNLLTNKCQHVPGPDPTCCNNAYNCEDNDCHTINICDSTNHCVYKANPNTCSSNDDCDDGKACTIDICDASGGCGSCIHEADTNCCVSDLNCNDAPSPGYMCTKDICVNNKCEHPKIAGCCVDDIDAIEVCDDQNSCTVDYCILNGCHHTPPKNGCCKSNNDCYDGNKCTTDICDTQKPQDDHFLCSFQLQDPNCTSCTIESAAAGGDCNDGNICTQDYCDQLGHCHNDPVAGCCMDKFDCDDGNACTLDICNPFQHSCSHSDSSNGVLLCCKASSQDVDCAFLNNECQKGVCAETGNPGETECVAQTLPVCTVNINYCQGFEGGGTLKNMGWNPAFTDGSSTANWSVQDGGSLGPDQSANFSYTPIKNAYGTCLASPIIQAAGSQTITVQYDREFLWNGNSTQLKILGSLDGEAVDWSQATVIGTVEEAFDNLGPETLDVQLPANLLNSNGLRLAFCLDGNSTYDVLSYSLDNICIVKGGKPYITACPVNQTVPFLGTKQIPLKAKDPDVDSILSFQLVQAPSFVTLSSALYFWLDKSWNTTLTMHPTGIADVGTHKVTIKITDNQLYSMCTFYITVSYTSGYLVIRPPEVPIPEGDAIANAIKEVAPGQIVQHIDDMSMYSDLSKFKAVFLVLGVFPFNHVLTDGTDGSANEIGKFQNYLATGGNLYMEGGDTWAYDPPTGLHSSFKVNGLEDSVVNGINDELLGDSIYKDLTQIINNKPKKFSWGFAQSDDVNNGNDSISAKTDIHRTQNLLKSVSFNVPTIVQVGHQDDNKYKTVASSIPFAGVQPGPNSNDSPATMMARILNFFTNGFVDCIVDTDCNDDDPCTTDTCTKSECMYQNTCHCEAVEPGLQCGDTVTVVSNGPKKTTAIKNYSCDPETIYTGDETSLKYVSSASRPITLTVSDLSNPLARVFVLREVDAVCAPGQCVNANDGSIPTKFAAAKNQAYYIVLDSPGAPAQATIHIDCAAAEICDDQQDNNLNNLVDCQDLESCCGDAACGEICDGKDNDCDAKTDEGCDDDGDGYCDAAIVTKGTPPICPNGNNDCSDTDGTVNPGVGEICGNNKDDDCNNEIDEEGGANCNYYWSDKDGDFFGGGPAHCLCTPTTLIAATQGGDCDDNNKKVSPGLVEICGNDVDDDCSGTQNDQGAQGCSDWFRDMDGDGIGVNIKDVGAIGKQCLCFGAGNYSANTDGDCNDSDQFVHVGATEICNNVDDNCNDLLDEGCDDDSDGFCDSTMGYISIGASSKVCASGPEGTVVTLTCDNGRTITAIDFASFGNPTGICGTYKAGTCSGGPTLQVVKTACLGKSACSIVVASQLLGDGCPGQSKSLDLQVTCMGNGGTPPGVCVNGAGDTNDLDPLINPAGKEICDNVDNNSDGVVDEGCDDDADGFCDSTITVVGAPFVCPAGGKDCNDGDPLVNPGAQEDCDTIADDDCNGDANDVNAKNCVVFFSDGDNDGFGTKSFKCYCSPVDLFKAEKTKDCVDYNAAINPGVQEICNGIDDDCDGVIDNGCDVDNDGYCAAGLTITGGTNACPNGGGDCDDNDFFVNAGAKEVCGDGIDNNCNGSQNDADALLCNVYYSDVDKDGFGSANAICQCGPSGTFTAILGTDCDDNADAVNPAAAEICDDIDNNCTNGLDELCDKDLDGYCDASKTLVGTPAICPHGGSDCNDGNGDIHPDLAAEVCDNVDDDCDGVIDNGCDKDKDGYCDATYAVITPTPPVCFAGINDCDDYNNDTHPQAPEICGNDIDDNCNGSQNDIGAQNCKPFYQDVDGDGYGLNAAKCLCVAQGAYSAPTGDDCDDVSSNMSAQIHPNQAEDCATPYDDNCNLDDNDENAIGCTFRALDGDNDGYGITGLTKCYCVAANSYGADINNAADCNDANAAVHPQATEKCNDVDDNCLAGVDEGCNGDGDKFCNGAMTTVGFPNVCAGGGNDCDDTKANVYPGNPELCDGLDNNCSGGANGVDEGCDDDNDHYCDANMTRVGTPAICTLGGADCDDTKNTINPGQGESCATTWDDNCNGDTNDVGALGSTAFGVDLDGDSYYDKTKATVLYCHATGVYTGVNPNDCDDLNNLVHPNLPELCDGKDNNCDTVTVIDEGCDDDNDHWCDAAMTTIGKPPICTSGGGDCNDSAPGINPGVNEQCSTVGVDDNCSGGTNDNNAAGCTTFYLDNDADTWAVNVPQCTCVAAGKYTVTNIAKIGDCDDTNVNVNPSITEVCGDGVDNNCNGSQNDTGATGAVLFYKDVDKDGYGPTSGGSNLQCFAQGLFVASLTGDCNDANAAINPGLAEKCDNLDNNCAGGADEGCDDDGDKFCDATMVVVGATGTVSACVFGAGDCNDTAATGSLVFPGQTEKCDNVDQNCSGVTDEGCDDDKDTYCDKNMVVVYGSSPICASTVGASTLDCNDDSAVTNPGKNEICDGIDNDCDALTDELCDKDGDLYCDVAMQTVGTPAVCTKGGGDCNDTAGATGAAINPGAIEACDAVDNNCFGGVDETCKDTDGDGYCVGPAQGGIGKCPYGGNDCDDSKIAVNPGVAENCTTAYDDNCDGNVNPSSNLTGGTSFYTDADGDGFGTGTGQTRCFQDTATKLTALVNTDCDDTKATVNPGALEICDGINNDCKSILGIAIDEGCDDDGDGYCDSGLIMASTATCANTPKPAAGTTKLGDDCVDTGTANGVNAANINLGKPELCNNADDNCSGKVDEGCDDDKDGYCDSAMTVSVASPAICPSSSSVGAGNDCNDTNAQVSPSLSTPENCKTAYDDNCDGSLTAPNANGCTLYYTDVDGDGFGVTGSTACNCIVVGNFRATVAGDCNDGAAAVYPGATEICDMIDNNCDAFAKVDEGCDDDKDGYCKPTMTVTAAGAGAGKTCSAQGAGVGTDCDDTNKAINPGYVGVEPCDGQDNNCTAGIDEACDGDTDGYCSSTGGHTTVGKPPVCLQGGGDCNDANPAVKPGASELCNSLDDNCNGLTDDNPSNGSTFLYDGDQDGSPTNNPKTQCGAVGLWSYSVAVSGTPGTYDCDDVPTACGANCKPGLPENRCDGYDNNCASGVDENCDKDGDQYCDAALATIKLTSGAWPSVCIKGGGDCDDVIGVHVVAGKSTTGLSFNPGLAEACDNLDNNCSGQTDEQASAACDIYPNANGVCSAGACVQSGCKTGYYDSNTGTAGCECYTVDQYEPNDSCGVATNLGTLVDGPNGAQGSLVMVQGLAVDTNDHDWFTFYGDDIADSTTGACDRYNVRAVLTSNPGVVFDVFRGGCPPSANPPVGNVAFNTKTWPAWPNPWGGGQPSPTPGWNQVCCGQVDFNWFTYFKDWRPATGNTSHYSEYGECPCSVGDTFEGSTGYSTYPGQWAAYTWMPAEWGPAGLRNGPSGTNYYDPTLNHGYQGVGWDYTKCLNDAAQYYVHVYRTAGAACSPYRMEISNGVYSGTGAGGGWGYATGAYGSKYDGVSTTQWVTPYP